MRINGNIIMNKYNRKLMNNDSIKVSKNNIKSINFNDLPSKTVSKMSDAELKKAVVEQAQKDAANAVFQGKEFKTFEESYVRSVSPDRKSIIGGLFNSLFGNGIPSFASIKHPSGSAISGSVIATFCQERGWEAVMTREEASRGTEICNTYNEAWDIARYGEGGDSSKETDPRITNGYPGYSRTV